MPYDLLKDIILHLKKHDGCPRCKSRLNDGDIDVLAGVYNPERYMYYGLFLVACPKCEVESMVGVEMCAGSHEHDHICEPIGERITTNEVLDVHNFLKNWSGDVHELFRK